MSTTIDQRVVEMRFDNKHFEQNVSTTMSTLDKLKQKLNFSGATKGLESVGSAANKVNMSGLANGVEAVRTRFSALEVMGVTALANITNSAVNAGKRIVSALTIDPIKTGLSEYETQINAVQTILANTESKGTTITDVNRALETLNKYADKTIYNFTEMTRNIGTFTAAGVDLETSVNAIQGIANLAAVSGSTSQQASTAMYQLSQALASGTVKLMDWNSVVNAGMGGEVFQNALKETARIHGVAIDEMIEDQGSFRETLSKDWLTTEILTETLNKFTMATEGMTEAEIEANRVKLRSMGYTEEQIEGIFKLGNTATNAATKVKTFTQLWDVLKEAAQSGWSQTWKIVIGDFEEAKSLFTPLADMLTGFINRMSDARNKLLEGAFGSSPLKDLVDKITGVTDSVGEAVETVKDYNEVVAQIIRGDWGAGQERWDRLTEAGYDWAHAQNLVNEQLGSSIRHTSEYVDVQGDVAKAQEYTITQLANMSDARLKELGYTNDQVEALRELQRQAKNAQMPLGDFIKQIDELNGRTLLLNSFKNVGQSIVKAIEALGAAWSEVFPPMTSLELYNIIAGLNEFSKKLKMSDDTADDLRRTFKGVFALIDIVLTLIGGPLKIAFKAITQLLGMFDMDILDVTASIGDAIVGFRDWIDESLDFTKAFEKIIGPVKNGVEAFREWIATLKESDNLPEDIANGIINGIGKALEFIKNLFAQVRDRIQNGLDGAPETMIGKLVDGIWNGLKIAGQVMKILAETLFEKFCEALGIHSPSTKFHEAGSNIVQGLLNGLQEGAATVWDFVKGLGEKIVTIFGNVDFGKLLAAGLGTGVLLVLKKFANSFEALTSPFGSIGDAVENFGDMLGGIGASFKASAWEKRSKAVLNMALAIGILAVSFALLTKLDTDKMLEALGILAALATIVGILVVVAGKFGSISNVLSSISMTSIATALLILIGSLALLSVIDIDELPKTLGILAGVIITLVAVVGAIGLLAKIGDMRDMAKVGKMLSKMAIALLIMVAVIKLASMLDEKEIGKGLALVISVGVLFTALVAVSAIAGPNASKAGGMILKMSVALLAMVAVIKLSSMLNADEINRGLAVITMVGVMFAALIAVSSLAGRNASKAGTMLLTISVALLIMIKVIEMAAGLDEDGIKNGLTVIAALEVLFVALIAVSKLAGQHAARAGTMLLMMSGALLVLTAIIFILSELDPDGMWRGVAAVSALEVLFIGLIAVTALAKDVKGIKGMLITLTVAVTLLAVAVAALSFIDTESLFSATLAMTALIGVFALLVAATKNAKGVKITSILTMVGVIVALAGVVAVLALITNTENAIAAVTALSILVVAFSGMAAILSAMKLGKINLGSMAIMVGVVALLAVIVGLLSNIESPDTSIKMVESLATLLVVFTAVTAALTLLGKAGGVSAAANGALALITVIGILGAAAVAIGSLMQLFTDEFFTKIETGLDRFTSVMTKIGEAIGGFVGGVIGGIGAGVLEGIGSGLTGFMENAQGFITGCASINDDSMAGAKALAEMILILTGASIIDGLASLLGGGMSLDEFGKQLIPFGKAMVEFSDEVSGNVDSEAIVSVANAGKILAEMASALPNTGGVVSWFTGNNDLDDFGLKLKSFGKSIIGFSDILSEGEINETAILAAANAGKIMSEMATSLPNTGGVVGWFMGNNDLDDFGARLITFGESIVEFSKIVSEDGAINESAITAAANAGKIMVGFAETLPNTGGVVGWFTGNNDIDDFGAKLVSFGKSIAKFSATVSEEGAINTEAITAAANAGEIMAQFSAMIPNMGGVVGWFTGDSDMANFGTQLVAFGEALVDFSDEVSGSIDEEAVASAASAGRMMAELAALLPNTGGVMSWFEGDNGLEDFGDNLESFGDSLAAYSDSISDINTGHMSNATHQFSKLIDLAANASGVDFAGLSDFGDALEDLGEVSVDDFVSAFSDAADDIGEAGADLIVSFSDGIDSNKHLLSNTVNDLFAEMMRNIKDRDADFEQTGAHLIVGMMKGMTDKFSTAVKSFGDIAKKGYTAIRNEYQNYYDAGAYIVSGFAQGISANTYKATAKARAMAKAATNAAENELGIHSPSKEFFRIGRYTVMGFVNALTGYSGQIREAGSGMAESARSGFTSAISKLYNAIDTNIDTQPTIRPVLDLSDVEYGASRIGDMFSSDTSVGVLANVNGISSMMNRRGQNGVNDEVVLAIDKLRKELNERGGDTYQINGITYDDSSNISTAVKALTRAALRERRV